MLSFDCISEPPTDPQLSTAKRQQRTHALNTTLSQAAVERRLAAAETTRLQLETRLRERDSEIERLDADRRWLAEREQEEREEKERVLKERKEEKVSGRTTTFNFHRTHSTIPRLDETRTGYPFPALRVEHTPRRSCRPPRQIRFTLTHHNPKARLSSCRTHGPRAPSRVPLHGAAFGARSSHNSQRRCFASAISPRRHNVHTD